MRRRVHLRDGEQDVMDVVAEVQDGVGDDGLGGGDAGGEQGERGGQGQGGLQLLHCRLLSHGEGNEGVKSLHNAEGKHYITDISRGQ